MSAEQPTVLPWHREAAKETYNHIGDWAYESGVEPIAAIIASHDQQAETLRLLERALPYVNESGRAYNLTNEILAHLAALRQTGGGK